MKDISQIIPVGYESRVSREALMIFTGMPDRKVRKLIEESKAPIVNIDDGYFIPDMDNPVDKIYMRAYYMREIKRAQSILRKVSKYKALMNIMEGQLELKL